MFKRKGAALSTIKVYRAMLSAVFKFPLPEISTSPILKDLIRSFEISAPRPLFPWDLDKVLQFLSGPPFEPLARASFLNKTKKALFLLAMATAKRVSELQALSFSMSFQGEDLVLYYDPFFRAKTESAANPLPCSVIVPSLSDFAGDLPERVQCPVRAIKFLRKAAKSASYIFFIGHKNKNEKYGLLGKEIESVQQEKDLGVVITNDLKSSNQCIEAVKKAQKLLGYIKRQFRTMYKETILTLYNALVRPHLEYAVQFWSPSLRKDIERLEAVQARATKLIPSIRHLGYVRRLERLNLYLLEKRRLRGQLIETFKMLKGVNNIDYRHLFTFSNNRTRSNGWKLELKRFNTSQCGNFFTYKIAPIWNRLPAEAVNSASVEQFKIELDKVIDTLI